VDFTYKPNVVQFTRNCFGGISEWMTEFHMMIISLITYRLKNLFPLWTNPESLSENTNAKLFRQTKNYFHGLPLFLSQFAGFHQFSSFVFIQLHR
jgi:hypothetical protein